MAQITLNIPDASISRVATAMCNTHNLPVSNANAKLALVNYIKQVVINYESANKELEVNAQLETVLNERNVAMSSAISEIETSVDSIVIN